jgi:glycine/D-amino acid oxidase-like deaminating enzyme
VTIPRFDVVIVGGGVIGCAAAYFLRAASGFRGTVLVVEPEPSGAAGATTRSVASIRHQFSTPENIAMSQFGTEFMRESPRLLEVDGEQPAVGFVERGYLFLATGAGVGVLRDNHALQRRMGAQVEWLEPGALAGRFPWLNAEGLAAGTLGTAGEGWVDVHALLHGFRKRAAAAGALWRKARAVTLMRAGAAVHAVRLDDGSSIACGTVINAAGIGATALAATAGIELPVQPRKRCVFYFETPARLAACPLVIDPSGLYFRPEGRGFICGIAPPEHQDPPCADFEVTWPLWDEVLWPGLAVRVPGFEAARLLGAWAGHYDVNLFDHNMILGAHPDVANLLFANGFSGHGLQHAPAVGRALAELVEHGRFRTLDLARLGWGRVLRGEPLLEANVV